MSAFSPSNHTHTHPHTHSHPLRHIDTRTHTLICTQPHTNTHTLHTHTQVLPEMIFFITDGAQKISEGGVSVFAPL